jgi:hypothetical protein
MNNRKIASIVLCAIAAALFAGTAAFGTDTYGSNVLVMPFDDTTWDFKDSEEVLTKAAAEAITASGKYKYVSPEQFAANWLKELTDKERKLFSGDPAVQMKNLKQYRPMFNHADLGTINEYQKRWGADLVMMGEIRQEGEIAVLYTEIISMATGRFYAVSDEFDPKEAAGLMKKQVGLLLAKAEAVRKVEADEILVPAKSVIGYELRATDGARLRMIVDYSSFRPSPELQDVDIVPASPIADGILPLKVMAKEKKPITFQYFYREGQFVNIKISTARPKEASGKGKEYDETLTVVSRDGYVIKFTFQWKNGEAKGIKIEPAVHPYGEVN